MIWSRIDEASPSFAPASLCDSFSAGNLKKMNRNNEPSKKHDTKARTRMFVSVFRQCIYGQSCSLDLPLRIYLSVDLVVLTVDSASSC